MAAWYTRTYRRNLVDMHIADWDPAFLSRFSPEDYLDNLRRARIEAPMLYLQSHAGLCYFPTKVGRMHAAFRDRPDAMRRLAALCREAGMHPVGYYSLIYNTFEEDRHPEWRLVTGDDGTSARQRGGRYGHLCPNNAEYRAFVSAQIAEMAAFFRAPDGTLLLDGMFYDMLFWPGICRCGACRARYEAETGRPGEEMPVREDWHDARWREFQTLRCRWMGEFAAFASAETRRMMPGVSVEHNYACAVAGDSSVNGSSERVNDACDYTGGDLYGDLYNHSFTAKYYAAVTKNPPFEYMTCRCEPNLQAHTITKTEDALAAEVLLTAAHHGASFIIDAIDPVGTMDRRVYDRIGRVFERQIPYEKYFTGTLAADAAVRYSPEGRWNLHSGLKSGNKECAVAAVRALIEENVPVAVAPDACRDFSPYALTIVPELGALTEDGRRDLIRYVEAGGTLYLSGAEDEALLAALLGARVTGDTETEPYLAPTAAGEALLDPFTAAYPYPAGHRLPRIEAAPDCTVLATLTLPYTTRRETRFASIHSDPPGVPTAVPGLLARRVGGGRVLWSAAPIEADGRRAGRALFLSLVRHLLPPEKRLLVSDAPRQVELVTFRDGARTLVSCVDLLCTDERLPVVPFSVSVRLPRRPARVVRLGEREEEIPFAWDGERAAFSVGQLVLFEMFSLE